AARLPVASAERPAADLAVVALRGAGAADGRALAVLIGGDALGAVERGAAHLDRRIALHHPAQDRGIAAARAGLAAADAGIGAAGAGAGPEAAVATPAHARAGPAVARAADADRHVDAAAALAGRARAGGARGRGGAR